MALVFDEAEQQGVTLAFTQEEIYLEIVDGVPMFAVFMEDNEADEMLQMIRNKLNARI